MRNGTVWRRIRAYHYVNYSDDCRTCILLWQGRPHRQRDSVLLISISSAQPERISSNESFEQNWRNERRQSPPATDSRSQPGICAPVCYHRRTERADVYASAARGSLLCPSGARGHAPENTLLAFDLAFDLGADAIECDVQRSRDGELVIIHDGTVNRTTNGTGAVAALTFADLRALDAGRVWRIPQRIPTLAEMLELVWRRGGSLNLEIKGESVAESVGTAEAVAPVLHALEEPLRARLLVSSFEHPAVALEGAAAVAAGGGAL